MWTIHRDRRSAQIRTLPSQPRKPASVEVELQLRHIARSDFHSGHDNLSPIEYFSSTPGTKFNRNYHT
ncbi:uncharacterized protein LAJ45_01484 [Morchella importuna]|uniref:uncharacterized protein n=1 Tax=Morchella importuna TaxID=1174673 RepID=UPI001E8D08A1|nr:uncharacterized protein LAJ45_01484 [Morchella importuna]KAH8154952.1 hypothetical protein LAJ45_01484 [Morchella importuna]